MGTVVNFFSRAMSAAVRIEAEAVSVGDVLHFKGRTTDLYQRLDSLHVDGAPVRSAGPGEVAGVAVGGRVRRNDAVNKVEDEGP